MVSLLYCHLYDHEPKKLTSSFGLSDENAITHIFYDEEGSGLASLYKRKLKHYKINFDKSEKILLKRADSYIQVLCLYYSLELLGACNLLIFVIFLSGILHYGR